MISKELREGATPIAGGVKTIFTGTYVVASALRNTGHIDGINFIATNLTYFAVAKGMFDTLLGIAFMFDKNAPDAVPQPPIKTTSPRTRKPLSEDTSERATSPDIRERRTRQDDQGRATGEDFPAALPLIEKIDRFKYSNTERYLRGGLQTLSGMFLLDGGIEAAIGTDILGLTACGINVLWRMAISSIADFVLAAHDLYNSDVSPNIREADRADLKRDCYSEVLIKGLNATGWTMLAILGPTNPIGLACLGLALLSTLYKNRTGIGRFFTCQCLPPISREEMLPTQHRTTPHR